MLPVFLKQRSPKTLPLLIFLGCLLAVNTLYAQPAKEPVNITINAAHPDWIYQPGEEVTFLVSVTHNGSPVSNQMLYYEIGPEKRTPRTTDSVLLKNGKAAIRAGSFDKPGFLRCKARVRFPEKEYSSIGTAAFDPYAIRPATTLPDDFLAFWENARKEALQIPLDKALTLMPERSNDKVNVYHISFQNYQYGSRIYGILCIPKGEGRYPAVLNVPGAGIRAYQGDISLAEEGVITLQIGIHNLPVTMPDSIYKKLSSEEPYKSYRVSGLENRDTYYFKRVFLGCLRAVDFIYTLPEFNGKVAVMGGSQGGALSIVSAALDKRIQYVSAYAPAMCDHQGYLIGRASGWPNLFTSPEKAANKQRVENSRYYDMVNFAQLITIPGYYSFGFNDETCPPTTMFAAYNQINAPKELFIAKETGHWYTNEQRNNRKNWILQQLKN